MKEQEVTTPGVIASSLKENLNRLKAAFGEANDLLIR